MASQLTYSDHAVVDHYTRETTLLHPEKVLFPQYVRAGMDILDVGVGGGRTTRHIAPLAGRYLGIDFAPPMVDACRARFPDLDFAVADAADLSAIADASFDLTLFSFNGIDYLPDDASRLRALAEFRRVTRPDGHIIISSHNARHLVTVPVLDRADPKRAAWRIARALGLSLWRAPRTLVRASFWQGRGYIDDPVHGGVHTHVSSRASIAADCAAAGLRVVETAGSHAPWRLPEWASNWTTYVLRRSGVA